MSETHDKKAPAGEGEVKLSPLVIDLGKAKAKEIKKLKKGEGDLLQSVHSAVESVREQMSAELGGKVLVPVVVVVQKKPKRRRGKGSFLNPFGLR